MRSTSPEGPSRGPREQANQQHDAAEESQRARSLVAKRLKDQPLETANQRGMLGPLAGRTMPNTPVSARQSAFGMWGGAVAVFLAGATFLALVGIRGGPLSIDQSTLNTMVDSRNDALNSVVPKFSMLGGTPIFTPVMVLLACLLAGIRRTVWPVAMLVLAAALSVGVTVVLKHTFARPRPPIETQLHPHETSGSIPSGHTLNATALIVTFVALLLRWGVGAWVRWIAIIVAIIYISCMALSRLYMGVHWFTDVCCGALIGLGVGFVVMGIDLWARGASVHKRLVQPIGT